MPQAYALVATEEKLGLHVCFPSHSSVAYNVDKDRNYVGELRAEESVRQEELVADVWWVEAATVPENTVRHTPLQLRCSQKSSGSKEMMGELIANILRHGLADIVLQWHRLRKSWSFRVGSAFLITFVGSGQYNGDCRDGMVLDAARLPRGRGFSSRFALTAMLGRCGCVSLMVRTGDLEDPVLLSHEIRGKFPDRGI